MNGLFNSLGIKPTEDMNLRAARALEQWDALLLSILKPKVEAAMATGFGLVVIQPSEGSLLGVEVYAASPVVPGTALVVNPNRRYYESGPPGGRISFYTR